MKYVISSACSNTILRTFFGPIAWRSTVLKLLLTAACTDVVGDKLPVTEALRLPLGLLWAPVFITILQHNPFLNARATVCLTESLLICKVIFSAIVWSPLQWYIPISMVLHAHSKFLTFNNWCQTILSMLRSSHLSMKTPCVSLYNQRAFYVNAFTNLLIPQKCFIQFSNIIHTRNLAHWFLQQTWTQN
jgi:hypothetical protein